MIAGEFSSIFKFAGYSRFSAKLSRDPAKKSGRGNIDAPFGTTWKDVLA
jgi:hypothetical protein